MDLNIVNEVAALQRLSVGQLRQRFAELFGETTAASSATGPRTPCKSAAPNAVTAGNSVPITSRHGMMLAADKIKHT